MAVLTHGQTRLVRIQAVAVVPSLLQCMYGPLRVKDLDLWRACES